MQVSCLETTAMALTVMRRIRKYIQSRIKMANEIMIQVGEIRTVNGVKNRQHAGTKRE
jgi:hypothetical protein